MAANGAHTALSAAILGALPHEAATLQGHHLEVPTPAGAGKAAVGKG